MPYLRRSIRSRRLHQARFISLIPVCLLACSLSCSGDATIGQHTPSNDVGAAPQAGATAETEQSDAGPIDEVTTTEEPRDDDDDDDDEADDDDDATSSDASGTAP